MSFCIHQLHVDKDTVQCGSDRFVRPNGTIPLERCEGLNGRPECPFRDKPNLNITGVGDVVHKITHSTGILKLVHAITELTGKDCGCAQRKELWNKWFPLGAKHNPNKQWAVAVTTAPRTEPSLQQCLASIVQNKWSPWIFAEPNSNLQGCEMFTITQNETRLGAWFNWLNACKTVLEKTDAKWILTVQDDTEFVDGAREWFEANPVPTDKLGMASFYTSKKYDKPKVQGWHRVYTKSLWGACAMAFPREILEQVVEHRTAKSWWGASRKLVCKDSKCGKKQFIPSNRFKGGPYKLTCKCGREYGFKEKLPQDVGNVDTAVGNIMMEMNKQMWFTNPSLSQHFAEYSAMGHGGNKGNRSAKEVGVPE